MDYVINILISFLLYISIPITIRYVILRKPIKRKWIAIGILVPIFIVFSVLINIQRDEAKKKIYHQYEMQYKPSPHMLGSPILYIAMFLSYGIMRLGHKKSETMNDEHIPQDMESNIVMNKQENAQTNEVPSQVQKTKPVVEPIITNHNYSDALPIQGKRSDDNFISKGEPSEQFIAKKTSDDFYVQAWDEINDQNTIPNKSLWAKAFAIAQGDEKKTQAKYIEFRVTQLQDEYEQKQKLAFLEAEKKTQIEALEAKRKAYKVGLQSKNSFDSLRPLAEKIKKEGTSADARDLIEKLGGAFDAYCQRSFQSEPFSVVKSEPPGPHDGLTSTPSFPTFPRSL